MTSGESVRHAAGFIEQADGHLDVLVNNAGITGPGRPHDYTADDMTEVLLTNVVGYVRLIHAFLPLLEKSDDPRIVNVSSDLGSFRCFHDWIRTGANVGTPLYAASAVNMMTLHFASLLPTIRINAINPGLARPTSAVGWAVGGASASDQRARLEVGQSEAKARHPGIMPAPAAYGQARQHAAGRYANRNCGLRATEAGTDLARGPWTRPQHRHRPISGPGGRGTLDRTAATVPFGTIAGRISPLLQSAAAAISACRSAFSRLAQPA